jgi:ribosomal protein S6--L-glutamate ligase
MGVILAETEASAKSIIEAFSAANVNIMVQEYIREAEATDIRAFVIDGNVVAAMKRVGKSGEFRSNLHRGGRAEAVELSPEEVETAIQSAAVLGLNVSGVDMLRSVRGPMVMEVNSSPGLEGIETATGIDVSGAIIAFLEAHARHGHTQTRGAG